MKSKDGFTPKELATDIVLSWIKASALEQVNNYLDEETPTFRKKVIEHLMKMHDKMLEQSGLNGIPMGESK